MSWQSGDCDKLSFIGNQAAWWKVFGFHFFPLLCEAIKKVLLEKISSCSRRYFVCLHAVPNILICRSSWTMWNLVDHLSWCYQRKTWHWLNPRHIGGIDKCFPHIAYDLSSCWSNFSCDMSGLQHAWRNLSVLSGSEELKIVRQAYKYLYLSARIFNTIYEKLIN